MELLTIRRFPTLGRVFAILNVARQGEPIVAMDNWSDSGRIVGKWEVIRRSRVT
jgi:hypothetical protein